MKNNKLFKWLYGIFMFLPMLAIGVCCAYVTFNKNAKDSYYGETINEKQVNYLHSNDLQNGMNVNIINGTYTAPSGLSVTNNQIWVDNVINLGNTNDYSQVKILGFYYPSSNLSLYMYDSEGTTLYSDVRTYNISFTFQGFKKDDGQRLHTIIDDNNYIFDYIYNKNSYLDNAFYYAIDKFNECGFNKVDFVSFFDFFNTQNNIYITFVNTYINYMLFVSLAFFIPRVLMWFIGFAYGLTDSYSGRRLW